MSEQVTLTKVTDAYHTADRGRVEVRVGDELRGWVQRHSVNRNRWTAHTRRFGPTGVSFPSRKAAVDFLVRWAS